MKLPSFLILVTLAVSGSLAGFCDPQVCKQEVGDDCTSEECSAASGLFCNRGTSQCEPLKKLGETCLNGDQCETFGADCWPDSEGRHRCSLSQYPGMSCSCDRDCVFLNPNGNKNSTCSNGRCHGLSEGMPCQIDWHNLWQCNQGLYCNRSVICTPQGSCQLNPNSSATPVCLPQRPKGAACTGPWGGECQSSFCMAKSATAFECGDRFSQKQGEYCESFWDCADGLVCLSDVNQCQPPATSSNKACDSPSSECPTGERCQCSSKTGGLGAIVSVLFFADAPATCQSRQPNPVGFSRLFRDLMACTLNDSGCMTKGGLCPPCYSEYCALAPLITKGSRFYPDLCSLTKEDRSVFEKCTASSDL